MEQLKDESSTNLYIEGYASLFSFPFHPLTIARSLPLTIDEPVRQSFIGVARANVILGQTLAALMAPHKIMSSRLFQTRLSHPPRTIAFVRYDPSTTGYRNPYVPYRLESRTSAEETIERLHGRMVRGWNDPGCRISVRFADTAEQRELRVCMICALRILFLNVHPTATRTRDARRSVPRATNHGTSSIAQHARFSGFISGNSTVSRCQFRQSQPHPDKFSHDSVYP